MQSDVLDLLLKHVEEMGWVRRGMYLHDRGWHSRQIKIGDRCEWVSPHDGLRYSDEIQCVVQEMLAEMEGRPTPRSGRYIEPERGESREMIKGRRPK